MSEVVDLAQSHQPISDFSAGAKAADFCLSDEQVRQFDEQGYLAGLPLLNAKQVAQLRREVAALMDPQTPGVELFHEYNVNESPDPDKVLFHALGAWRVTTGFHDLLWHPGVAQPASQLLRGAVRFWHDQLFCKPAHHGGVVAWHQDYSYWTRTQPLAHLTCFIAIDDTSIANGCIHYIPGSHKWDLLPITGLAGDMAAIRKVLDDEQWALFQEPVAIELKAGQCSFHHGLTVHGSYENTTPNPRRATVVNMFRDGVVSNADEPLLANVPVIPTGAPVTGRFFPLLSGR